MNFDFLLITTGVLTSLLAGVFFGYAVSVNSGLGRLKDEEYVRAMQSINRVIQNPLFFLTFLGPVLLLPITTYMAQGSGMRFTLLLTASIVYIVGSFILTMAGNVPLNEKLDKFTGNDFRAARSAFQKPWNRLHSIRTLASVVATVLVFAACMQ